MNRIVKFFNSFFEEKVISEQASKESIEAGKALYEYFQKQVEHEKGRFQKFEDKASKFLTMVSVIITAYLFVINNIFEKISSVCSISLALQIYQIILIILFILLFLTLCASWLYLLKVLKPQITRHLPTSQDTINVYINYPNKLDEIYHDNANKMKQVIDEYKTTNKVKVQFLSKAYNCISISGILFVIILPLSLIYKYLT
ncbi:hypothetical protein [Acinetobacter baumannii]|uniref:hypothetical protein n=1 Tax=Acinetobacter baumannii TaxID=470 RepID=UPI0007A3BA01|nr:hypothetical protein [Acinetobacter baumannii]EHU2145184.1 hypothetical protein [Acinetobacter baumannii]EHU2656294.1 hypothetical protein [Acinetobacter baumannii]EHU2724903.1 hypothetical protein [Acinetobacter baumannii]EHU2843191.1 hypothetical protein [Acinetobacter baumannii]EHU3382232.1 hypothetical protein [Acinetobacter baumannii]